MKDNNLKYNKSKISKSRLDATISRFGAIYEIAVRNEFPFKEVKGIYRIINSYFRFNSKVYSRDRENNKDFKAYNPALEEEVFELTERYFNIHRIKKLNELRELRKCEVK